MNKSIVIAVVMLLVGFGLGSWLDGILQNEPYPIGHKNMPEDTKEKATERKILFYRNPMNPSVTSPVPAKDSMGMDYVPVYAEEKKPKQRKILFYRSPMNPSVTSPVPAKDAMGMDYVPVYADDDQSADEPSGTVKIDGTVQQQIAVRTTKAVRDVLSRTVRAVGRVDYDEEMLVRLHPKIEGWVEKLFVDKTGQWVKENTELLSIYSPQLVTSQQEYLLALNNLKALEKVRLPIFGEGLKNW